MSGLAKAIEQGDAKSAEDVLLRAIRGIAKNNPAILTRQAHFFALRFTDCQQKHEGVPDEHGYCAGCRPGSPLHAITAWLEEHAPQPALPIHDPRAAAAEPPEREEPPMPTEEHAR